MNQQEIVAMFESRAGRMIAAWPEENGKDPFNIPQHADKKELIKLLRAEHEREPVKSVLDVGGGIGRWVPLWKDGLKVKGKYTIIEPTPSLAAEAERRHEARHDVEVILGDLISLDAKLGRRKWDLGFTFTAMEHMPPSDMKPAAEIMKRRCKRIIAIEMVQENKANRFCGYVFKHYYKALFGEPRFMKMIDPNKALMIFQA